MADKKPGDNDLTTWLDFIEEVQPCIYEKKIRYFKKPLFISPAAISQQRRYEYYETRQQSLESDITSVCKRMRGAKVVIEGQIDLHGFTLVQAQQKLQVFLLNAQLQKKIWVLVITGKGRHPEEKTLQKQVPQWLDQLPYISGYMSARPPHGGTGALYVRLKRV